MQNGFLMTHLLKSLEEHAYSMLSLELIPFISPNPYSSCRDRKVAKQFHGLRISSPLGWGTRAMELRHSVSVPLSERYSLYFFYHFSQNSLFLISISFSNAVRDKPLNAIDWRQFLILLAEFLATSRVVFSIFYQSPELVNQGSSKGFLFSLFFLICFFSLLKNSLYSISRPSDF